ncbi:MAG: flagellin [Planctomycetes bacterium]|nr:flagellin [Planctomycetota bacterium]
MGRINSNISSLTAQQNLTRSNNELQVRLSRLSTGLRINRGADDPAGLIVSERLRSELSGIDQGVKNSERASSVIATTEGALNEVSELLSSIKALVVEGANTGAFSKEEILANQLQIDSAIDSITRISNTASFAGLKLLNGSLAYSLSGVSPTAIAKAQVHGADFGDRATVDVNVDVLGSAQTANLYFNTNFAGSTAGSSRLPSAVTLEFAGPDGVVELVFASNTPIDDVVAAVNSRKSVTGLSASRQTAGNATSGLVFSSIEYGRESFVSVKRLAGANYTFAKINNDAPGPIQWANASTYAAADRDVGKDVTVLINGAVATGRGLDVQLRTPELDLALTLTPTFGTTITTTTQTFVITGGGAKFQLGPQVTSNQQVNIGVDSIAATRLGGTLVPNGSGGLALQFLSSLKSGGVNSLLGGNLANASKILETSIDEVSGIRGRLGAFERNVIQTNIRSLQSGLENITASESAIRDADFAVESSKLTRAQVLVSAGTSVLAAANQSSQSVLQLLG